jgi:hypothetical protein
MVKILGFAEGTRFKDILKHMFSIDPPAMD